MKLIRVFERTARFNGIRSIAKLTHKNEVPLLILHNTYKTLALRRGCIVGRAGSQKNLNLVSLTSKDMEETESPKLNFEKELIVPLKQRQQVNKLIEDTRDIFAKSE